MMAPCGCVQDSLLLTSLYCPVFSVNFYIWGVLWFPFLHCNLLSVFLFATINYNIIFNFRTYLTIMLVTC